MFFWPFKKKIVQRRVVLTIGRVEIDVSSTLSIKRVSWNLDSWRWDDPVKRPVLTNVTHFSTVRQFVLEAVRRLTREDPEVEIVVVDVSEIEPISGKPVWLYRSWMDDLCNRERNSPEMFPTHYILKEDPFARQEA